MDFSWQVLIALSLATYSVTVLLQRVILRVNLRPIAFSIFSQLLPGILLGAIGLVTGQLRSFELSPAVIFSLLGATILYAVGSIVVSMALRMTEASKFTVLFAGRGLVTIVVATILLQEKFGLWPLCGALLIFAGVACASWEAKRLTFQKGDYLALLAAVIFGVANVNDRFALQQIPIYPYMVLAFLLPPLLIAAWRPSEVKYIADFMRPPLLDKMLVLSVLYSISTITFFGALAVAENAAQVVAVNLISVILIVGLSVIFLKERSHLWQKLLGAVLAFVGLLLLN